MRALSLRLRALAEAGHIRTYLPGVRGFHLFGAAPGMYFLNLGHPEYGQVSQPNVFTVCESLLSGVGAAHVEGLSAFSLADGIRRSPKWGREPPLFLQGLVRGDEGLLGCDASFVYLVPVFGAKSSDRILDGREHSLGLAWYLQAKFEEYASRILSEKWDALLRPGMPEMLELTARINEEIFPEGVFDSVELDGVSSDLVRGAAVGFIYRTSLLLARRLHNVMRSVPGHRFADMDHCVIPGSRRYRQPVVRAVVSVPKEGLDGVSSCTLRIRRAEEEGTIPEELSDDLQNVEAQLGKGGYVVATPLGNLHIERVDQEIDLPESVLMLSGLLWEAAPREREAV